MSGINVARMRKYARGQRDLGVARFSGPTRMTYAGVEAVAPFPLYQPDGKPVLFEVTTSDTTKLR